MTSAKVPNGQVLEAIQALTLVVGRLDYRLESVEQRLESVEQSLDAIEHRLDAVEHRLDGVEHRLDGVENRLGGLEHRLDTVGKQVTLIPGIAEAIINYSNDLDDHSRQLKKLRQVLA